MSRKIEHSSVEKINSAPSRRHKILRKKEMLSSVSETSQLEMDESFENKLKNESKTQLNSAGLTKKDPTGELMENVLNFSRIKESIESKCWNENEKKRGTLGVI
jgi:response regulator of citrate/malate metabolism